MLIANARLEISTHEHRAWQTVPRVEMGLLVPNHRPERVATTAIDCGELLGKTTS